MRWGSVTFSALYFNLWRSSLHIYIDSVTTVSAAVWGLLGVSGCVWGGSCWGSLSLITRAVFVCSWCPGVVTPLGGAAASLVVSPVKSSLMFKDGGERNRGRGENLFTTSLMGIWFSVIFGSGGNTLTLPLLHFVSANSTRLWVP